MQGPRGRTLCGIVEIEQGGDDIPEVTGDTAPRRGILAFLLSERVLSRVMWAHPLGHRGAY